MTPEERKTARNTARIIRSARKHANLTQTELAQVLEVSQSAVSKLESGLLIPSVYQWFEFCRYTNIPTDSHEIGYLDSLSPISIAQGEFEGGFRIPKKYSHAKGSSIRSIRPFVLWLENKLGEKKASSVLKDLGVDPDFFMYYGHQISLRFCADLVTWMIQKGYLLSEDLRGLAGVVKMKNNHGSLAQAYASATDAIDLLSKVLSKAQFYEANFFYKIEDQLKGSIDFSISANEHILADRQLRDESFGQFLAKYRQIYFENISELGGFQPGTLEVLSSSANVGLKSVYRLQTRGVA